MAVTETVKIVFEADTKAITDTTKELTSMKKATEEDVAAFKKLSDETKNLNNSLSTTDDNFVSLRTQVKQAKDEVVKLSAEFGEFSAEAQAARVKAGQLADQMSDLNRQVNLLNPEAKAKAFVNFGSQVVGAFQIATGALQAFGSENEQVQKLATKLQGALNVTQGIASLKGLKESYQDIKIVLGLTTAAQTTLTTATTAGSAATTGASAALRGFAASLSATGIGAIVVALGALVGAMIALGSETDETAKKSERLLEIEAERAKLAGDEVAASRALKVLKGELTEDAAKRLETEDEINKQIAKTSSDLAKLITNNKAIIQQYQTFAEQGREQEFFAGFSDEAGDVIRQYFALQKNLVQLRKKAVKELQVIDEQANQKKIEDVITELKRKQTKEINDAFSKLEEEKKIRSDALALLREQGKTQDVILNKQIENNQWEIKALQTIKQKNNDIQLSEEYQRQLNTEIDNATKSQDLSRLAQLKATKESLSGLKGREDIQKRINQLLRDNVLINAQIANFDISEGVKAVEKRLDAKSKEIEFEKERGTLTSTSLQNQIDANNEAITSLNALIELDKQRNNNLNEQKNIQDKINQLTKDNEKNVFAISKALSDEQQQGYDTAIKSTEIFYDNQTLLNAQNIKDTDKRNKADKEAYKKLLEDKIKLSYQYGIKRNDLEAELANLNNDTYVKDREKFEQSLREKTEFAQELTSFLTDINRMKIDKEIADLEEQKEKGIITEEQYQERLKQLKTKAARADKEAAIFQATIGFSQALINALSIKPPSAIPFATAAAAAIAGLNLAKIIATPLPKFKQGTLSVPGVDTGQDTVMAMLRPGEAVIPTETNREYAPVMRAIYRREINAKELNDFVTNRDQGAFAFNQVSLDALYRRDLKVSAITQAGKSAQLTAQPTKITADVDVQQLTRAMSKNKAVEVTNTAALGEAIAAQLSKRINPRQVI